MTDCVTSLLANTEVDLDILVVDDASPDDSWSVVQRLPELDSRVRVTRNEHNQGLIGTANAAIMAATGDYVVLISADDAVTPGWLDRGVAFLEENPRAVLVYGPTRRFSGKLPDLHIKRRVQPVVHDGHDWIEQACDQGVTAVLSPEVIVRTSAQHEVGGYRPELPNSSDMEMWLRLASSATSCELAARWPRSIASARRACPATSTRIRCASWKCVGTRSTFGTRSPTAGSRTVMP